MIQFQSRWWQLAAIQIGGAICLPIFVVGHALATKYGLISALMAVGLGNAFLLAIGIAAASYAAKTRMTTAEAAADTFGEYGKIYFAFALIISMLGWFAIQLDLMGLIAGKLFGIEWTKGINLFLGVLITLLGLRGFRGMEILANICLPLLVMTIGYAVYESSQQPFQIAMEDSIMFEGIALAIAAAIGAVIDMPTFFRMAKSSKDALYAALILFGFALPLLEGVGIFLAAHGSSDNLVESLANEHSSFIWKGWVAIFIILAGWTTNNTNLYSAAISMKTALNIKNESFSPVVVGIVGTLLSMVDMKDNLFIFLECIGVLLSSAGGVMLFNQMTFGGGLKSWNIAGLILGVLIGMLSFIGFELSGSGVIDAFGVAFVISLAGGFLNRYKRKRVCDEAY